MIPYILLLVLAGQSVYEMDEIVVTATRYPLALQNIAVATIVIDRAEIESFRALDITEILSGTAGVDIKDYGIPGTVTSMTLRGVPSNGTLILINGQPLNMMTTGMADLSVIDINTVERIEIVKGPVSSIYGANTLGGVVNFITTKEYTEPEIKMMVSPFTTTFDKLLQNKYISLAAGVPLGRFQTNLSGIYLSSTGRRSNSDLIKYDLQGTIKYHTPRIAAQANVFYDKKDYGLPGPLPRIDSLHPLPFFGDSTATSLYDREDDVTLLSNASITWDVSEKIYWEQKVFGDRRKSIFHTRYAGWMNDTIVEDHTYHTFSAGYSSMFLTKFPYLEVSIGMDARVDSLHTETISEQTGDTTWNASTYTFGAWCQAKTNFNDVISFTPSIRIDHNRNFGTFLSAGIGLVSVLQANLVLKTSAGRTFRAPSLNDLYWPLSGNRDLTPEYGWVYEMRIEASPMQWMSGAVSLFMRDILERIAWMPDTGGLWKPQNINELSITGVDINMNGQINANIDLSVQGTYLSATQRNDEIIYDFYDWVADTGLTIIQETERVAAYIPRFNLRFSQHIHLPYFIDIDLCEQYVSEIRNYYTNYDSYPVITTDEKFIYAYFLLNASITKTFHRFFSLSIGMKNVLNVDYATQFGYSIDDLDYPMPGRTYFVNICASY